MEILKEQTTIFDSTLNVDKYRQVVEDHLLWLTKRTTNHIDITDNDKIKWAGDFYGLLNEKGVSPDQFFLVARMNGLTSSNDDLSELLTILLPNETDVELINESAKK